MYRLIYQSTADKNFFLDSDLKELLSKSQQFNRNNDISGILLHIEGEFIQVLEGKKDIIINLYEKIKNDKRHNQFNIIDEGEVIKRYFSGYFMAFDPTHYNDSKDYENLRDFNPDEILKSDKDGVIVFLNQFLESHKRYLKANQ